MIPTNGGEARLLTPTRSVYLNGDFTPDGTRFVVLRQSGKVRWEIVTLDLETGRELRSTPLAVGEFDEPYFLSIHPDGRRMAVNIRLAEPDSVAHIPIDHFDGLDTFTDLPRDGRTVKDMWF